MKVTFVTGNQHKADKTSQLLGRELDHEKVDLDELQTIDIVELAEHKVKQAYAILQRPVIVDDYSLSFDALNGLPGPFIKFFISIDDGLEKLCRMLDPFENRRAGTACVIAFYDGQVMKVFEKYTHGDIVQHPIGDNGIHTDRIFTPDGYDQTRAQMDDVMYDEVYRKVRPLDELKLFLDEYYG